MQFTCTQCNSLFIRKSKVYSKNVFCNRSCAAKYNNKRKPKRKSKFSSKDYFCICGNKKQAKSIACLECYKSKRSNGESTLAELIYTNQQTTNRYSRIRDECRSRYKNIKCCQV